MQSLRGIGAATAMAAVCLIGGPTAPAARGQAAGYTYVYPPTAVAPAQVQAPVATGWVVHVPGRGWVPYQPPTSQFAPARRVGRRAVPARRRLPQGSPIGPGNPEFGTGRTYPMIKPWLPTTP
ncbi:hypothetical protein [Paludisphaera soli]|uniref:hypothetical protein n=1 Tax=Paludisphaera soli TaxID=2712865 RepID=UPI0013EB8C68|nr:hypothetical protein [Paludisphaera soli]